MKKVIAILMVAVMLTGLTACGTKKNAEEPKDTVTADLPQDGAGTEDAGETEGTEGTDGADDAGSGEDEAKLSFDEEKSADVIIVGAGAAGLAAAVAAADEGAQSIIIVEKLGKTGGSLNYTSGSMSGAETIIQELDGVEDTKESYVQDILSNGGQMGNEELIRIYVDEDVDAIQWLWDKGLSDNQFTMIDEKKSVFAPEHQLYSIPRTYKPKPDDPEKFKSAVHEILDTEVAGYSNITIDFYTEITELVCNEQGQVLTALGTNSDTGKTVKYDAAKGIIMATGGYSGNSKIMGEYAEHGSNYLVGGADSADGKGIRIMQLVGAAVNEDQMSYIPTFPMGLEFAEGKGAIGDVYTWKTGGIYVNQEGERFINETLDEVVPRETALEEQTGAVQYNIFTDKIVEDLIANNAAFMWNYYYAPEDGIGHKLIKSASSLEELAGQIGVPADALIQTVEEYNAAVEAGGTDEFGRDFSRTPTTYNLAVNKIEGDVYYAVPIKALVVMTLGGVSANENMQVVDEAGNVIPGLYAAGEVVGGIWGKYVSGGTGVMGPVCFGRIAGRNVMATELETRDNAGPASFVLDEALFAKEETVQEAYDMAGLKDGSYEATVDGQSGPMTVEVEIAGGSISKVTVVSNNETETIAADALEKIPTAIVEGNTPNVDAITGATLTSNRIMEAVKNCLDQAK